MNGRTRDDSRRTEVGDIAGRPRVASMGSKLQISMGDPAAKAAVGRWQRVGYV